jgi:predicted N-acyltransferase
MSETSEETKRAPISAGEGLSARTIEGVGEIDAAEWDACVPDDNPFLCHAFFRALEESRSAERETGWLAQHLVIEDGEGAAQAILPLYLKGHSQGEFVFDHGWADAFSRAGGRYYPKLFAGVPFTPVPGPRLLVRTNAAPSSRAVRGALIEAARGLVERYHVSSLHVVFPDHEEWQALGDAGFLLRTGVQFHWRNEGYGEFDDFLATLASRKRKQIRRERRDVLADGVSIETLSGSGIEERHWDALFACYQATSEEKWGMPYLTREFFSMIGETMAKRIVLVMAFAGDQPIAGALNLRSATRLYGRNWGCMEPRPFLHFECCYYRAIDYAIEHGLEVVEAGVQGGHKLVRGYRPVATYSAHWIAHPGLRDAVANFLERETEQVDYEIEGLERYTPYRKGEPD